MRDHGTRPAAAGTFGWAVACLALALVAGYAASSAGLALPGIALGCSASVVIGSLVPYRYLVAALVSVGFVTVFQVDVGGLGLRLDMALLPATLVAALVQGKASSVARWFAKPAVLCLIAWLVLQAGASVLVAPDPAASLKIVAWMAMNLSITMLVLGEYGLDRQRLEDLLLTGAGFTAATGIASWAFATVTGSDFWGANTVGGVGVRAQGIAYEPNILAATCAFWALVLITRNRMGRREGFVLFLLLASLLLANTRAAYLALGIGLLIAMLFRPGIVRRLGLIAPAIAIAAATVAFVAPQNLSDMTTKLTQFGFADQTSTYRFDSWQLARADLGGGDWMFGLGTSSFQQRHIDPTSEDHVGYYLGNFPLQVLYDSGIVGVILVGLAAISLASAGILGRRVALLAAFVIISVATSPFFFSNWWMPIALALAVKRSLPDGVGEDLADQPGDRVLEARPAG